MSAAAVLTVAALSCSSLTACVSAPVVAREARAPSLSRIVASGDEALALSIRAACTPTGLETCFNASDDDCNGLVDEGCGLATGVLQVVVAWDQAEANVDLELSDPNGEPAEVGQTTTLGLTKDRDCPGANDDCRGQNVEVVTLEGDELPKGRYRVRIELAHPASARSAVNVWIGGHIGRDPIRGSCVLSADEPQRSAELWIQGDSSSADP